MRVIGPRGRGWGTIVLGSLLLSGLLVLFGHPDSVATAPPAVIRDAITLVAKRNGAGERQEIGTAFHIGGGLFRTAAHVARATLPKRFEGKGYDQWALYSSDEFGNPAEFLASFEIVCVDHRWVHDPDGRVFPHDSALLRVKELRELRAALPIASAPPRLGEAVSVWGFPNGTVLFESRASVAGMSNQWIVLRQALGAPVVNGHSGSPVLNRSGQVVGIMSAGVVGVGRHGGAIPIADAEAGCPRP